MTDTLFATSGPEISIRVLMVSAIVGPLDDRADAVLRRAVPRSARSRRPDGSTAVSLARLRVLVDALELAGYVVHLDSGEVRR